MGTFTTYNSWGRTRSPKNLAGANGTAITLEANTNNMLGSASGYKTVGYATENQRFLHVLVTDANGSGTPGAITIFGYCHAFERWFESESCISHPNSSITSDLSKSPWR